MLWENSFENGSQHPLTIHEYIEEVVFVPSWEFRNLDSAFVVVR